MNNTEKAESQKELDIKAIKATPKDELPVLPETVRNGDTLQWFYRSVVDSFTCLNSRFSPLYLRRSEHGLAIRINNEWKVYRRNEQIEFWRDAMAVSKELQQSNWSTKRQNDLWNYFLVYAPEIDFEAAGDVTQAVLAEMGAGDAVVGRDGIVGFDDGLEINPVAQTHLEVDRRDGPRIDARVRAAGAVMIARETDQIGFELKVTGIHRVGALVEGFHFPKQASRRWIAEGVAPLVGLGRVGGRLG